MKAKDIVIAIIFFNISSCDLSSNKIDIIESKGLDADNLRLTALLFHNKDTGFIAGSSDKVIHNPDENSNQFAFVNRTALLYTTTDGGKAWTKKSFGEGRLGDIIRVGNKIFINKVNEEKALYHIYSSIDLGVTWNEERFFPNRVFSIFSINNLLCSIATDSSKRVARFFQSYNNGNNWSSGLDLQYPLFDAPIQYDNQILYLSNTKQDVYFPNLVIKYSVQDDTYKIIELPKEFNCYFLTKYNEEIKLVGLKEGHIAVYSLLNSNRVKYEYSYFEDKDLFPQGYYNNKGEEWIVVGKRGDADVLNRILKTIDNGKSWKIVNFKKEKHIKPFYFFNENGKVKACFYAGSGMFQILK